VVEMTIWKFLMLGRHVSTYLCTLLGCCGDVPQINMGDGNVRDVDNELKGDGALYIHEDAHVITYL